MATSTFRLSNIERYNNMRDFLINYEGYTYKQLFGLKYTELDGLFEGDASIVYKVTKSKRAWLRVQLDKFIEFFDLQEGWTMIEMIDEQEQYQAIFSMLLMSGEYREQDIDAQVNEILDNPHIYPEYF